MNNENKRILTALLVLMVTMAFAFDVLVFATIGAIGSEVLVHNRTSGIYPLYSPVHNEVFNWIEGYTHAFSCAYDGYGYQLFLYYTDDEGDSWNTAASMSGYYWHANDEEYSPCDWHDAVYDNETDCVHVVWFTSHYTNNEVRYARFIDDGDGTFTRQNQTTIDTLSVGATEYFSCAITLNASTRAPIITAMVYESGYKLNCYAGDAPDPTSFIETDLGSIGYVYQKSYTYTDALCLLVYSAWGADGKLQGRFFNSGAWVGAAFDITEEDLEQDGLEDDTNNGQAGWSAVCPQDLDFNEDLTTICFSYINATLSYKAIIWTVSTQQVAQTIELEDAPTVQFWAPNLAMKDDSFFATIYDESDTNVYDLYIYEFYDTSTSATGTYLESYQWYTTALPHQTMSKTIQEDYLLLLTCQAGVSYSLYSQQIAAEGYLYVPPEHSWFGLYGDFFFGLMGVIMMLVAPSWLAMKLRKGWSESVEIIERAFFALMLWLMGFALCMAWLGGSFWGS